MQRPMQSGAKQRTCSRVPCRRPDLLGPAPQGDPHRSHGLGLVLPRREALRLVAKGGLVTGAS